MLKNIWQKIKQNHLLLMAVCCLIPIALIIVFISLLKNTNNYWIWLVMLLCPILHILIMRGHKHDNSCGREKDEMAKVSYKCPECGLEYQKKEWAEKCEVWCGKYKSCNLEITKHAIKSSL